MRTLIASMLLVICVGCGSPSLTDLQSQREELQRVRSRLVDDVGVLDHWLSPNMTLAQTDAVLPLVRLAQGEDTAEAALEKKKAELRKIEARLSEIDGEIYSRVK